MEMEPGKLFIGGISWDTTEDRLREYFQSFGDVVEAVIMKDRATGRARGFGFIVFANPNVAEKVVTEKHVIDGRIVEAKKAVPRDDQNILNRNNGSIHGSPGPARTKKIFVGGLASTVTESDFKKYFDQFGAITDVVVMYDHNTQRPRGFGFITYDSEDAVDKVLYKTFHELNGKMVEVKRAVPKELSPGPSRGHLGGYNHGLGRISSFLNGYSQGYNLNSVGGYGRLSPVSVGRNGYSPFGPGYAMGMNFETRLSPSYGVSTNLSNLNLRGLSPSYSGNSNRFGSTPVHGGGDEGNSSIISTTGRNFWGNGNLATNSPNSNAFIGSASGNTAMGSLGSIGALWGSSPNPSQVGGVGSTYNTGSLGYGSGDVRFGSGGLGYGRNGGSVAPGSSSYGANGGYDGAHADIYDGGSLYGDSTWKSSQSELDGSGSFGFGLRNGASDVMSKNSGYIGGYGVTARQSTRGIAA